ncbi:MAG: hypothetical protein E7335_04595 [Clostridiales bacterium]|nr:hypothetical protein [Clostridiales bacterium]
MRYEGRKTQTISFPLGGIGTGSIGLSGNGRLLDWEIRNRPNKNSDNGFSFFAIKAEEDGKLVDARVLQGDYLPPYHGHIHVNSVRGFGTGPDRATLAGVPNFRGCVFEGTYPYAHVHFSDEKFPGKPILKAFNPFIPSNADDSGIPAAFFTVEVQNDTDKDLDYTVAFCLQTMFAFGWNRASKDGNISMITLLPCDDISTESPAYGNLSIATDNTDCSLQEYWYRGRWFDMLSVFWQNFCESGLIRERTYSENNACGDVGVITARVHAKAGETKEIRFVLAWNFPNFENYWNPMKTEDETETLKNVWKNYYAKQFPTSQSAALYALREWDRLDSETRLFHDALHGSTLPDYAVEAIASTMSVLKTPTCLRLEDGTFWGWEGVHITVGSCEGSCTHVWNYAYAQPFLFPELERSMRTSHYKYDLDDAGGLRFRTQVPLGRAYSGHRPCVDGQYGDVMKVYREWKLCGDTQWLKKLWPAVKKSIEFAWSEDNPDKWDANCDGVLEGRQHHTLDMELFGPSPWLNGFYLAGLKAGAEMAKAMGEQDTAQKYLEVFENGRKWIEENLFNGEYYEQKVDIKDPNVLLPFGDAYGQGTAYDVYWNHEAKEIKYQIVNGCSIDQMTPQWHARLLGLGDIFEPERVRSALASVYKYNNKTMRDFFNPCRIFSLNDERGAIMCAYPDGVEKPVLPVVYAEETMYGFEYTAAVTMLQYGLMDEGLDMIRSIRARHDGENRNPWNEMECGNNYARSMASYSILLALSGFEFDMTRGYIGFAPKINESDFRAFWAVDGAWGNYAQCENEATLTVLYGTTELSSLKADGRQANLVLLNGQPIDFSMQAEEIAFAEKVALHKGDILTIK